ncbi:MAG: spermidine synthase [Beijerinckiaceae bacterium]|jgi:spermidine synthase|nr:spermidine synthase [Beijerinckiaceae bacterium]
MNHLFEELDYSLTSLGPLSLRRRRELSLQIDIYEVILGQHHLMSSLFTESERALGDLGMAATDGQDIDVLVGGLGLGYTAEAVLNCPGLRSLTVIDIMQPVIDWHEQNLLPIGRLLADDSRCTMQQGDFFAMAASREGFDIAAPGRKFHAILLDIDHSPEFFLDTGNAAFYQPDGLRDLQQHLHPGGIFGLWSDAGTDRAFVERLRETFASASAEPVTFHNPLQNKECTQTVYLARKAK